MANESNVPVSFARGTSTAIAQKTPTDGLVLYDKTKKRVSVDVSNGSTVDRIPIDGISLTQAQYDALSASEKVNGTYYITDGGMVIGSPAETITFDASSYFTPSEYSPLYNKISIQNINAVVCGNVTQLHASIYPSQAVTLTGYEGYVELFDRVTAGNQYDAMLLPKQGSGVFFEALCDLSTSLSGKYADKNYAEPHLDVTLVGISDSQSITLSYWLEFTVTFINSVDSSGFVGASSLTELSDVDITTPSDGQALVYDATDQKWENKSFDTASPVEITDTNRFTSNMLATWLGSTFSVYKVTAQIYGNVTVLDVEITPTTVANVSLTANSFGSGGQLITYVPKSDEYDDAFIVNGNVVSADIFVYDDNGNRITNIKGQYGKTSGNNTGYYFFMSNLSNVKVNNYAWRFHTVFINSLSSAAIFGLGASSFSTLSDVSVSSPSNGQVPIYNSTSQKWENGNIVSGPTLEVLDISDHFELTQTLKNSWGNCSFAGTAYVFGNITRIFVTILVPQNATWGSSTSSETYVSGLLTQKAYNGVIHKGLIPYGHGESGDVFRLNVYAMNESNSELITDLVGYYDRTIGEQTDTGFISMALYGYHKIVNIKGGRSLWIEGMFINNME